MIDDAAELPTLTCGSSWGNAFEGTKITLHSATFALTLAWKMRRLFHVFENFRKKTPSNVY